MPASTVAGSHGTYWRYRRDDRPPFDPVVFDERALAARGALDGRARAGRGNTHFLVLDGHALVLRHYRRGGLVRHLSERRYLWTGIERTRAVREFELLRELEAEGLSVPRPHACAVNRHGLVWSGSLVTHRLPGQTLADRLDARGLVPWEHVGRCIARFHAKGVRHADLNAHNVMLDGENVFLIDFDRASRRRVPSGSSVAARAPRSAAGSDVGPAHEAAGWQRANLDRLRRSLAKLSRRAGRPFEEEGVALLRRAWQDELARLA